MKAVIQLLFKPFFKLKYVLFNNCTYLEHFYPPKLVFKGVNC